MSTVDDQIDQAYVERAVLRQLERGPVTLEQLAERIDAPHDAVRQACATLARSTRVSEMDDGRWCA
jgi:DNA-binding IclR family transcriptional regulator